jgi:hypothetical protein
LSFKLQQEGVPYGGDVLGIWVECFDPVSHIAGPSGDFWSFDKSEGK